MSAPSAGDAETAVIASTVASTTLSRRSRSDDPAASSRSEDASSAQEVATDDSAGPAPEPEQAPHESIASDIKEDVLTPVARAVIEGPSDPHSFHLLSQARAVQVQLPTAERFQRWVLFLLGTLFLGSFTAMGVAALIANTQWVLRVGIAGAVGLGLLLVAILLAQTASSATTIYDEVQDKSHKRAARLQDPQIECAQELPELLSDSESSPTSSR